MYPDRFYEDPLYNEYVVLDLETTGLHREYDKIIEIGALKITNGEVYEQFHSFINPGLKIPARITEINGITDAMVKDAPSKEEVLPIFLKFISDLPLVAHNASFDIGFIEAQGKVVLKNKIVDTLTLCRRYYKDYANHRLSTVCQNLCINAGTYHRALNDCWATAQVYETCKRRYELGNISTMGT